MLKIVDTSLESLLSAETYSQIHGVITVLTETMDFRYFAYQYWPGTAEYGDPEFSGVVQSNYPEAWLRHYVEMDFYAVDPVRLYGTVREGVTEWKDLPGESDAERRVMQDAAGFGLGGGIVGSFYDGEGGRLQLAFSGPAGEGDISLGLEALPVVGPLITVAFRRALKLEERLKWLTQRQRDVFMLLRRGERRERIAHSLDISLRQVDRHIASIKDRVQSNLPI